MDLYFRHWFEFDSGGNKNIIFKVFFQFCEAWNEISSNEDEFDFSLLNNEFISIR